MTKGPEHPDDDEQREPAADASGGAAQDGSEPPVDSWEPI